MIGGGSSLPLRKDSAITEALNVARERIRIRVQEAVVKYFTRTQGAGDAGKRALTTLTDLAIVRREVLARIAEFDRELAEERTRLDAAIAAFDLDARELEAWVTAATASDKLRPKEQPV